MWCNHGIYTLAADSATIYTVLSSPPDGHSQIPPTEIKLPQCDGLAQMSMADGLFFEEREPGESTRLGTREACVVHAMKLLGRNLAMPIFKFPSRAYDVQVQHKSPPPPPPDPPPPPTVGWNVRVKLVDVKLPPPVCVCSELSSWTMAACRTECVFASDADTASQTCPYCPAEWPDWFV